MTDLFQGSGHCILSFQGCCIPSRVLFRVSPPEPAHVFPGHGIEGARVMMNRCKRSVEWNEAAREASFRFVGQ
jgi:hypothetical protein